MTEKDPWLDELLRHQTYIDDGGFGDEVVARLPPRRPGATLARTRVALLLGWTATGLAATLWFFPGLQEGLVALAGGVSDPSRFTAATLAALCAVVVTTFGLLATAD